MLPVPAGGGGGEEGGAASGPVTHKSVPVLSGLRTRAREGAVELGERLRRVESVYGPRRAPHFQPLVLGVRWLALAAAIALAPARQAAVRPVVVWALVLTVNVLFRTARPLSLQPVGRGGGTGAPSAATVRSALPFLLDLGLVASAVVSTGYWQSPFVFCLLPGVMAAGFARGYVFAARLALVAGAAVAVPYLLEPATALGDGLRTTGQWVVELALVAVLAGYARRMFGEAERQQSQALDRMTELVEANDLLVSLHRVAQQLPASLNLDAALASTVSRLKSDIPSDVVAVLLPDGANGRWVVAAAEGTRPGRSFADHELPPALAATAASSVASLVVCVQPGEGLGPELLSHTGLYAALRARGALVGLVALEHHAPGSYGRRDLQLLDGFVEPAALAIDNARWFSRLRAIGADEERVRIARDMHDRLGQSLASVAFGLDRIRKLVHDEPLEGEIDELRAEVREAITEVRETLGDLRTGVSADRGIVSALTSFLERVEDRSGIEVNFSYDERVRLPINQEQEMWRIAQEAITNVERHAQASHLSVRWEYDGRAALLAVADDGRGFVAGHAGRPDSYGITGMTERADAISATLVVDSAPGRGTVVRCRLPQHAGPSGQGRP
jgi:signal transduction histidine kinase